MSQATINPAIFEVVRKPVVTEKSTLGSEQNKITFRVANDATKGQVKEAVETIFNIKVIKVNVINVKGKTKRFRGREGKRSDYKKAIVSIAAGQTIDMTAGV